MLTRTKRTKRVLSQQVKSLDLVFYGHVATRGGQPTDLWIDTVVVVDRVVKWRGSRVGGSRRYALDPRSPAFARRLLAPSAPLKEAAVVERLLGSDLYSFNLKDAEPQVGRHHRTAFRPHCVIIGAAHASRSALSNRSTSFVPLWTRGAPVHFDSGNGAAFWPDLARLLKAKKPLPSPWKPPVEISFGDALYDAVIIESGKGTARAGSVGIPPFRFRTRSSRAARP